MGYVRVEFDPRFAFHNHTVHTGVTVGRKLPVRRRRRRQPSDVLDA